MYENPLNGQSDYGRLLVMKNRLKRLAVFCAMFAGLLGTVESSSVASTEVITRLAGSAATGPWMSPFLNYPVSVVEAVVTLGDANRQGMASPHTFGTVLDSTEAASWESLARKGSTRDFGCRSDVKAVKQQVFDFWNIFENHKKGDRDRLLLRLDTLSKEHPEDPELALLQGLGRLWVINEPDGATTSLKQASYATQALKHLKRAQSLCPTDSRIPGWIAPTEMRLGRAVKAPALVAEGVGTFHTALPSYPEFNMFTLVLAQATEKRNSPGFREAVDAIHQSFELCDQMRSNDPACRNGARVRHNVEGTALLAGDLLTKQGDVKGALRFYNGAKASADFERWPFREVLEERIATAGSRARAYEDSNPHNDPPLVSDSPIACASCHAAKSPSFSQR